MQFSFCLILLSSIVVVESTVVINDIERIQCTSRCQFTVSFVDALKFPDECQETNQTSDYFDDAVVCGIEYTLNYDTEQIDVNFYTSDDAGSLGDQKPSDFLVQTIKLSLSPNFTQTNTISRKYGCNSGNDCAKKSYVDSIDYLINQGKAEINNIKKKLHKDSSIIGPKSRRYCTDSQATGERPALKCPNGLCYYRSSQYQLDEQRNEKTQHCQGNDYPVLHSEIEQHTPASAQKDRDFLEYKCNKHVCNRDDVAQDVRDFIGKLTNAKSTVENIVNEKKSNASICQTISSMILVLFLFSFQLFI